MADPTTLLEPSFEEVIAAIEQAVDLPAERRVGVQQPPSEGRVDHDRVMLG